jgi:hypothetical protein
MPFPVFYAYAYPAPPGYKSAAAADLPGMRRTIPNILGRARPGLHALSRREAPQHPGGIPICPDWVTREAYVQGIAVAATGLRYNPIVK